MNDVSSLQLKDIHLPHSISMWPMTSGWYFLILLVIVLVMLSALYITHRIRLNRVKKIIWNHWLNIKSGLNSSQMNPVEIDIFLKRIVFMLKPNSNVLSLTGMEWINFLNEISFKHQPVFSNLSVIYLKQTIFEASPALPSPLFIQELEHWLKSLNYKSFHDFKKVKL